MPSLKDLRNRIDSVKSTRKITSAMKMVAAAKLRRAQEQATHARPFAEGMGRMVANLATAMAGDARAPRLMTGSGKDERHLIVVVTADRGLCGGFNTTVVRETRNRVRALRSEGKQVELMCVGRKGADALRRDLNSLITDRVTDVMRRGVRFDDAKEVATKLRQKFEAGEFDVCTIIYNRFVSAITQQITVRQLIPLAIEEEHSSSHALYEFEPDQAQILEDLLPRNLAIQTFRAMLESQAGEQGARMTAMDNATRNAGDMIDRLTLTYNRTRQAVITSELIEIISGAEAL
ncbi:MAG: F0F1 ATP synthase subunit gamma [Rhodospirillaceae bacterium]|nr:F0F1 ATP synthase subunit gamma [Rhodospirillaceae bacterium]MCA8931663.1 F0F1 ATP synthase subunit gamma [Rhodospirillaceae bacterium]